MAQVSCEKLEPKTYVPPIILAEYERIKKEYEMRKKWTNMCESELWGELCLCILSSNVPYEMAKSAFLQLYMKELLDLDSGARTTAFLIYRELSRPIYQPKKKDGSFRSYRFPRIRASEIAAAKIMISETRGGLKTLLQTEASPHHLRMSLAETFPGIGMKQASHFLRNIAYSDDLAIIDTHILKFLRSHCDLGQLKVKNLQKRHYLELEEGLRLMSERSGLTLSILDNAIWNCARGGLI